MKQFGSLRKESYKFYIWANSKKKVEKFQVSLKSDKNNEYFYMQTFLYLWSRLVELFLKWELFNINIAEIIKAHILRLTTPPPPPPKTVPFMK